MLFSNDFFCACRFYSACATILLMRFISAAFFKAGCRSSSKSTSLTKMPVGCCRMAVAVHRTPTGAKTTNRSSSAHRKILSVKRSRFFGFVQIQFYFRMRLKNGRFAVFDVSIFTFATPLFMLDVFFFASTQVLCATKASCRKTTRTILHNRCQG
jgi:hypothetical protein